MPNKKRKPIKRRSNLERPFCGGQWTTSRYFGFIRSALRQATKRWGPINEAKYAARTQRKINKATGRLAWHSRCAICNGEFPSGNTQVDHIEPAGTLKSYEDLPDFVRRLFCEKEGLRVLCTECHRKETERQFPQ